MGYREAGRATLPYAGTDGGVGVPGSFGLPIRPRRTKTRLVMSHRGNVFSEFGQHRLVLDVLDAYSGREGGGGVLSLCIAVVV